MSFLKLLDQIDADKLEDEARDKFLNRKDALGKMSSWGKKLAVSALPLGAVSAFATPAKAQSNGDLVGALNFALTLEFLERNYYRMGAEAGIGSDFSATFQDILDAEEAHVTFLQETISSMDEEPVSEPEFDFTAGGNFDPFNNQEQYLLLSQAFEDTGVRAYKGQAGAVASSGAVLTAALQIHSVEARHAAAIRNIRELQGWIPEDQPDAPDAVAAVYAGEDNVTHAGIDVTTVSDVGRVEITEGWDEILTQLDVTNEDGTGIADPFIVDNDDSDN